MWGTGTHTVVSPLLPCRVCISRELGVRCRARHSNLGGGCSWGFLTIMPSTMLHQVSFFFFIRYLGLSDTAAGPTVTVKEAGSSRSRAQVFTWHMYLRAGFCLPHMEEGFAGEHARKLPPRWWLLEGTAPQWTLRAPRRMFQACLVPA